VNIEVVPFKIASSNQTWLLVIFDETTKGTKPGKSLLALGKTAAQREMIELRRELAGSQEIAAGDHRRAGSDQRGAKVRERRSGIEQRRIAVGQ